MAEEKTSLWSGGLLWFGAAVSIAEIATGALLAPLGWEQGLMAIALGHGIGCLLLFLAGHMGALTGRSAMETVAEAFGKRGGAFFAICNIVQLVGWTAVMVYNGAAAAQALWPMGALAFWCALLGILIGIWVLAGPKHLERINMAAVAALLVLVLVLSVILFRNGVAGQASGGLAFGQAVELSAVMPISWLPLIADYTRKSKSPRRVSAVSAGVYFFASCWMYALGLGAALYTGQGDISPIMVKAGLGAAALCIVLFSTVTTTFLDVYSAGVSAQSLHPRLREKPVALAVALLGAILAAVAPVTRFEVFLYAIGTVFAPMAAILVLDFFVLQPRSQGRRRIYWNLLCCAAGWLAYRYFLEQAYDVGTALPAMGLAVALRLAVYALGRDKEKADAEA